MCGIVASLSEHAVAEDLINGLKRLEYRGYDSSGLALIVPDVVDPPRANSSGEEKLSEEDMKKWIDNNAMNVPCHLFVDKHVGKVVNLWNSIMSPGNAAIISNARIGIAHTRWATHGPPSKVNAHPHCSSGLAVIHNGIIENHELLRNALKSKGYTFVSETDTEVVAHLIRHIQSLYDNGNGNNQVNNVLKLEEAVCLALSQLQGAYGLCVIDERTPDVLIGARKGSPLILGVSEDGDTLMLASDATAIAGTGKKFKVVYLMEEDVVICTRNSNVNAGEKGKYSYEILNMQGNKLKEAFDYPVTGFSVKSVSGTEVSTSGNFENINPLKHTAENSLRFDITKKFQPPKQVKRALFDLTLTLDRLEKGGHEHFMLKEILEQPSVLRDCMRGRINEHGEIKLSGVNELSDKFAKVQRLIICACGTSYHSGLIAEYLIESIAKIPVEVEYASEFRYRNPLLFEDDIVIVISQSGETADTLECVRIGKQHKCTIFGIVNVVGSTISRETDAGIYLHIGPEVGVASTKAFTGQVTALCLLALDLARRRGTLPQEKLVSMAKELLNVPSKIEKVIEQLTGMTSQKNSVESCLRSKSNSVCFDAGAPTPLFKKNYIENLASTFRYANNFLYLGRGYNYPSAMEGALKLKEISYIHAEGYPAAEMKHGPIALIDALMPVIIIAPKNDKIYFKIASAIEEVRARRGNVVVITTEGNEDFDDKCEFVIKVPETLEEFSPLIAAAPLQLLAYYIAKLRGCEIDHPRNLAKSVTVE